MSDTMLASEARALQLRPITPSDDEWRQLDCRPGRLLYQTRAWIDFVRHISGGTPVVAEVAADGEAVGHFFGVKTSAFGLPILGSPLAGWTTGFMGFSVDDGVDRRDLVAPLRRFAFRDVGAAYLELRDRELFEAPGGTLAGVLPVLEVDLARDEDAIFGAMTSPARRAVRRAEKLGVTIEECGPDEVADFADDYYAQLVDVFAKQHLVPTYGVDRVRALVEHVFPTGALLLLRARCPEGRSIATGIFPGWGSTAYFWGGASWREHQHFRPNEALMWHAFRYWRARGVERLDLGGGGSYKLKYAPSESEVPTWGFGRVPGLLRARRTVAALVAARQRARGRRSAPTP